MSFKWDKNREKAAALVADGTLTEPEIAAQVGVSVPTVARWKVNEEFKARVDALVESARAALEAEGIANRQNRLKAYNDRARLMAEVIRQRAENLKTVPAGGNTGLLVRTVKGIGKGEDFQVVEEYQVDTALLREMRETEKQAAIEVGEWTENVKHSGTVETVLLLPKSNAGG